MCVCLLVSAAKIHKTKTGNERQELHKQCHEKKVLLAAAMETDSEIPCTVYPTQSV